MEPAEAKPSSPTLSTRDFERLSAFIEGCAGIRLPPAKKSLLESRLARRLGELGARDFSEYCDLVLGGGAPREVVEMLDRVTTNKTDFFREAAHFDVLTARALPALAAEHGAGTSRPLKVWSAGCSTGEEPYTLAIVLSEVAQQRPGFRFEILATDLSTRVLRHATRAVYPETLVNPVPLLLRKRYLLRSRSQPDQVRMGKALRDRVRFGQLNLLDREYRLPGPVDVIFCRNVFIYFEQRIQDEILLRFARNLVPGGFLFLGHSESLCGRRTPFESVAPTVYRRTSGA